MYGERPSHLMTVWHPCLLVYSVLPALDSHQSKWKQLPADHQWCPVVYDNPALLLWMGGEGGLSPLSGCAVLAALQTFLILA